jgi:GDPmannose 4,6-dehydratase
VAFDQFGLNWENYVTQNEEFMRPTDILISVGDPSKAYQKMGWKAKSKMRDVVKLMIENEK